MTVRADMQFARIRDVLQTDMAAGRQYQIQQGRAD
jgi:hypothetical protein